MLRIKKVSLALLGMLFMGLFFTHNAVAQTATLDVDRLYEKYKGRTETTIFVGDKEINARVLISYNTSNRPYRIIVYGEAVGGYDLEELVDQLCASKVKDGYRRLLGANVVNFDSYGMYENNVEVKAFQKGTQYAKYGIKKMEFRNQVAPDSLAEGRSFRHLNDFFYFEVGDAARKKARKPEKFNF